MKKINLGNILLILNLIILITNTFFIILLRFDNNLTEYNILIISNIIILIIQWGLLKIKYYEGE